MPVPLAAVDLPQLVSLVIGVLGVSGLIFTALRWRRDDTTAVINQQDVILKDMKTLNDELRTTSDSLRTERDALREQVTDLTGEVEKLRRIEKRLDRGDGPG
jgi:cell division protein FtsB